MGKRIVLIWLMTFMALLLVAQDNGEKEWEQFLIQKEELKLDFSQPDPALKLDFNNFEGTAVEWKKQTLQKFTELIDFKYPETAQVSFLRSKVVEGVKISAYIMQISELLSIPAYVLEPAEKPYWKTAVMAIHGHGSVEPAIGTRDDYHHKFALELAKDGHLVLAPELRGFSTLSNLAEQDGLDRLDYWDGYRQFSLATDGFLYGKTMVGETIEDLIRWENWFATAFEIDQLDVTGISYGGDLAVYYPVFSKRVNRIFCSGSMGSFTWIFRSCYNAPAHCIPAVLNWMDRAEIAGLNAPSPICIHYGEYDIPGNNNFSAAYNPSGKEAYRELQDIYQAFNSREAITWLVSKSSHHEMDIPALLKYLE